MTKVCNGRHLAAVMVLFVALGVGSSAHARQKRSSLKRVTLELVRAIIKGDHAKAKSFVIAHRDLAALTRRAPAAKAYKKLVARWIDKRVRELGEAQRRGKKIEVGKPRIVDVHVLPKGSKLHRRVVFANVFGGLHIDGKPQRGMRLFFVDVGARWRLSIKK